MKSLLLPLMLLMASCVSSERLQRAEARLAQFEKHLETCRDADETLREAVHQTREDLTPTTPAWLRSAAEAGGILVATALASLLAGWLGVKTYRGVKSVGIRR